MRRFFFLLIIPFLGNTAIAQDNFYTVKLKGELNTDTLNQSSITLYSFYGTQTFSIDTVKISNKGKFEFKVQIPPHAGYYRLQINPTNYTDVILKPGENPQFSFENGKLKNWINVKSSNENEVLLKSRKITKTASSKIKAFAELEKIALAQPETYFSQTTLAYLPFDYYLKDTFSSEKSKYFFIHDHYFDYVDFKSPDLIYSTLLPNIFMRYFEQYTEYDEAGFKSSVDVIMKKSAEHEMNYNFALDYLINLFKQTGPEIILEYIIEKYYYERSCGSIDQNVLKTQDIIDNYNILLQGNKIPDFKFNSLNKQSDSISIYNVCKNNKAVMLIFWSSYCHYCANEANNWNNLYEKYAKLGFEMVFISLDTDSLEWKKGIQDKKLNGLHTCDLLGWESTIIKQLHVNRTPFYFLLLPDGTIGLKDKSFEQLNLYLLNYLNKSE